MPADATNAVAAAQRLLAGELGVAPDTLSVSRIDAVDWPTSALGCPQPGRTYLQVITPGYRILIEHAGTSYEVHTDQAGRVAVRC